MEKPVSRSWCFAVDPNLPRWRTFLAAFTLQRTGCPAIDEKPRETCESCAWHASPVVGRRLQTFARLLVVVAAFDEVDVVYCVDLICFLFNCVSTQRGS